MTRLALDYLGTFRVTRNAQPITNFRSSNVQGLLVYLSLQAGRAIPRDLLATLFWPNEPEKVARANFRQSIYQLRKVLGDDKSLPEPIFLVNRQTVTFNSACDYTLDVEIFLEAIDAGSLEQGLALYAGDLLPGFTCDSLEFEDWLRREREHLHQQAVGAAEKGIDERLSQADYRAAQRAARRLLRLEPWHERGHRQLMRALALSGDRAGGLAAFARCQEILLDELGAEPDEKTVALAAQIEAGALEPSAAPEPAPVKPTLDKFKIMGRLDPLPDQQLFGIEAPLQIALDGLTARDRPWLVALDGIGGIGKSSLAHALVHHFLDEAPDHFDDIAWVSAKQEEYVTGRGIQTTGKPALDAESLIDQLLMQLADGPYPTDSYDAKRLALLEILNKKRSLVVIDNLETVADYMALLPILRVLSRPSKFLLTSRMSLHAESDVHCISLTELSLDDAVAFLRYEAGHQRLARLANGPEALFFQIYETVGGNPLALKLVLGQAHLLPLETILADIERADTESADQLYLYIYWQAWQMLDREGRQLLLSLPIMPNGSFEQLQIASRLDAERCQQGLAALRALSLIEVGGIEDGGGAAPRYRIHRLTETFLLHEVVKWQAEPSDVPSEVNRERHFFEARVTDMLDHWRAEPALVKIDVAELDREKDGILKAINFGLDFDPAWPVVKELISALTSYMERRGHWEVWRQTLERAIATAQRLQDIDGELVMTNLRGRILQRQSKPEEVIGNYRRVIRLARLAGNEIEEARACSNLGFTYIDHYHWWRAEILSCHALSIFERLNYYHGIAHTHNHLGWLYAQTQNWQKGLQHLTKACQVWEMISDQHNLIRGLSNLGFLFNNWEGQSKEAVIYLEKALKLSDDVGDFGELPNIIVNLSYARNQIGQLDLAKELAFEAERVYQAQANYLGIYRAWEVLGLISNEKAIWEDAKNYFENARDGFKRLKNREGELRISKYLLDIYLANKMLSNAKKEVQKIKSLGRQFPALSSTPIYINALENYSRI